MSTTKLEIKLLKKLVEPFLIRSQKTNNEVKIISESTGENVASKPRSSG